ncbi:MAG: DNA/RNA non-specific endonuclease [Lachnospiraceae bacterium]|nr:DNA/RNA non-specific endonuclease [Lachnospiraceae bacterium]
MKKGKTLLLFAAAVVAALGLGITANAANDSLLASIPAYSGQAYVTVNGNQPFFADSELTTEAFENYSALDVKGRCGVAYANVCKELMPTESRGEIGMVKPSGWHTVKYPGVIEDLYLYNRCHLIGYQLAGENANPQNLITGTRYLNTVGMLPFENQVADYVNRTGHHVLYRVTPLFRGDNLVADGVLMEARSVEDNKIKFNVFCYNVQPHISINYATGDSALDGTASGENAQTTVSEPPATNAETAAPAPATGTAIPAAPDGQVTYVLNTNTHKFHVPSCSSVGDIKPGNRQDVSWTHDECISHGYVGCKRCNP